MKDLIKRLKQKNTNAVSEITGTMLLLFIAVALFSVIYYIVLSDSPPIQPVYANIQGEIKENTIFLTHMGGESIILENSQIYMTINGKTQSTFLLDDINSNGRWDVGETISCQQENLSGLEIQVQVSDTQSNSLLFQGLLQKGDTPLGPLSLNTSVNYPSFSQTTESKITLSATGDNRLSTVDLWYRYSTDNESWGGNKTIGEMRVIENVDDSWTTVDFWNSYDQPVIIATYNLESESNAEACVRIDNVASSSCNIRIQNPGDDHTVTAGDVHVLIIEQGFHFLNDGRKIEAFHYLEADTAENNNWNQKGTQQTYQHSYSTPVVLGTVMSSNDDAWSVPYFTDGNQANPPSQSTLFTSKHVGEDSDTSRIPETISYVVVEQGTGKIEGISYKAALGSDSIDGVFDNGNAYSLDDTFAAGVATQGGMDGGDGSWTVLYGSNPITTNLLIACEEDTIGDTDRSHTTEQVSYWVFSKQGNITSNESIGTGWVHWDNPSNPDSDSPWAWDFDFPQGPGYYEFYSIGRNGTENETAPLDADARCQFQISSHIDSISPYHVTFSPFDITATGSASYDNITMYYRYSDDNITWEPSAIKTAILQGEYLSDGSMNLNQNSLQTLRFDQVCLDNSYFNHSEHHPTRLTVLENGDYLLSLTHPLKRLDTNSKRTAIQSEIYVNNIKQDVGVGRSSYVRMASSHSESSNHLHILLTDLSIDDYIQIKVKGITSAIGSSYPIQTSDAFTLYAEYIHPSETMFSAMGTETTSSTDLNQDTAYEMEWIEERTNDGYLHSDISNPEEITLKSTGAYLVFVNIPLESSVQRANIKGKILLDDTLVDGGIFQQGYIRNLDDHTQSSIHWSGAVITNIPNRTLTISVQREANSGTVNVGGEKATLCIRKIPDESLFVSTASTVESGNNWNPSTKSAIEWTNDLLINTSIFTHSETMDSSEITVHQAGDYHLVYTGAFSITNKERSNNKIFVEIDGSLVAGAESKSNYIRRGSDHDDASTCLSFLLKNVNSGDVIKVYTMQEANNPIINDETDSLLLLWKKETNTAKNWMIWNSTTNPDVEAPWSWEFLFPKGNCYYEFASMAFVNGFSESFPSEPDSSCFFGSSVD